MNIQHGSFGTKELNTASLACVIISLANSLRHRSPFWRRVKRLPFWGNSAFPCADLSPAFSFVRRTNLWVEWKSTILYRDFAKQSPSLRRMRMPQKFRRSAYYKVVCRVRSALASFNSKVFQPVPNRLWITVNQLCDFRAIHLLRNVMLDKPFSAYWLAKPLPCGFT